jgi:RHS repeat-associated protein
MVMKMKSNKEFYFYHPDHLSSSSWITDQDGEAVQHLQYLPFGEPYVDQRTTGWQARHTFSGKERDEETGYSYFGARYYDSDLSVWLSVDPLASKYPGWSPYNYCLNNPIKLIDPDGCDVEVTANENGTYTVTGGTLNSDKNIYIMKDGKRTGEVLGQTLTENSFFGDDGNVVKNAIINPNDNSGQDFLDNLKSDDPSFYSYAYNARNGEKYDFKSQGGNNELNHHRGMPIKNNEGNTVYATARDVGNYGAGYVASRNGVSWGDTRYLFDTYQTYKSGGFSEGKRYSEGMTTQRAQRAGYGAGVIQRGQDRRTRIEQWGTPSRMPNGQSLPRR